MQIKTATIDDIEIIVDIWNSFLDEHDGIVTGRNPLLKDMNERRDEACVMYENFLKSNVESQDGKVLIAEEGKAIAGYSLGYIKDEIPIFKLRRYGYISDLFVKKEFRGQGVSTRLMDAMIRWFKDKGAQYASIGFYADNHEAHEIYRKWGFFDYKIEARKRI
jgi:ribosomal protein S18 acetylase RimI-like enzyme